jgi:hypothetical protein
MNVYAVSLGVLAVAAGAAFVGTQRQPASGTADRASSSGAPAAALATIKNLKIFFGHQSVGNNILDGVREVAPGLRIERTNAVPTGPMIADRMIGRNGSPSSKLADFSEALRASGAGVDIAMMKFCYVDFEAGTNVELIKQEYKRTFTQLSQQFPQTTFVHVTVPLTVTQAGVKAIVKRLLGKPLAGEYENRNRSQFNEWLRKEYPVNRLFDLAAVESRAPNGNPVTFDLEGRQYEMLYAGYSDDGGHLIGDGRRLAAVAFLDALNRAAQTRQ